MARRATIDPVAEHNKDMWERLARAGMNYTRPFGRPPSSRAGMRRFMDPRGRLKGVRLEGARVLGLAAAGGGDAIPFSTRHAPTHRHLHSSHQTKTGSRLSARRRGRRELSRG